MSEEKVGYSFFRNRFLGQKLLDRDHLVICSNVMIGKPVAGPEFRPLLQFFLSKFSSTAIALILKVCLYALDFILSQYFH